VFDRAARPASRVPSAPEMLDDTASLLARVRGGDRAAAGLLFDQHAPAVERLLLRTLGTGSSPI
jgi:hypothetical protein